MMRKKAVSGMMTGHERDQLESAVAVAKKVSESNQGAYIQCIMEQRRIQM